MDIAHYIKELDKNTGDILQVLKECSEEQLEKKTGDAWSILEILDHLLVTDKEVYSLLSGPPQKMGEKPEVLGGALLKRAMSRRDWKVSAPEFLLPKGDVKNESEFIERFLHQRGILVNALEHEKIVIDNGIVAHPVIGDLSKSDWLHFIIYHADRHILQIKERLAEF